METEEYVQSRAAAFAIVDSGVVHTNFKEGFTWVSGIKSPIYCDCRELISLPDIRKAIVQELVEQAKNTGDIAIIAGTATAGIPWAAWVAEAMNLPMVYVRSKPKGHGKGKQIEGLYKGTENVFLVEDTISSGKSVINAMQALKKEGLQVQGIGCILRWSPHPLPGFEGLNPLVNGHDIAATLAHDNAVNAAEYNQLITFIDETFPAPQ